MISLTSLIVNYTGVNWCQPDKCAQRSHALLVVSCKNHHVSTFYSLSIQNLKKKTPSASINTCIASVDWSYLLAYTWCQKHRKLKVSKQPPSWRHLPVGLLWRVFPPWMLGRGGAGEPHVLRCMNTSSSEPFSSKSSLDPSEPWSQRTSYR